MSIKPTMDSYRMTTATEVANRYQVDPQLLEKAMSQMGPEAVKIMGDNVLAYFRAVAESLQTFTDRSWEPDVKALPAQSESPDIHYKDNFLVRDTSNSPLFEERIPVGMLEKPDEWAARGWFTKDQVEAIKVFFHQAPQGHEEQGQARMFIQSQSTGSQGERGFSEQHQNQDEQQKWGQWFEEVEGGMGGGFRRQAITSGGNTGGRQAISGPGGTSTDDSVTSSDAPSPPPPPPPGLGGTRPGTPYDDYQQKLVPQMKQENDYLNANFSQGDPYYGWFQALFGSENWYRNFSAKALTELQTMKAGKDQMLAEMARINPKTAEGQMKIRVLQQKLGDLQQSERQIYDHISAAQKANNERKELVKAILDMFFQTNAATIRNIGR